MVLVGEGGIGLDDPLEHHLRDSRFGELTVRRLLAHSSGLQREPPGEVWETLRFPRGEELLASGERVFFGRGGAMPGFLAMLLGRRREGIGAGLVKNASTPAAAVEEITAELVEPALELFPAGDERWRPKPSRRPWSPSYSGSGGRKVPFVFWWEGGMLRARPTESGKPRAVSIFEPAGPEAFRVAEGRERGELLRIVRDASGSITKPYWATYPVTRTPSTVA
jgi:CubicO group peptidase (beta-lactamase class C family)